MPPGGDEREALAPGAPAVAKATAKARRRRTNPSVRRSLFREHISITWNRHFLTSSFPRKREPRGCRHVAGPESRFRGDDGEGTVPGKRDALLRRHQGGRAMANDVSEKVGKFRDQATSGIDAAAAQAKDMAKKGAGVVQETMQAAGETGAAAWDVAQQAAAQAREAASELYAQGERGAREIAARVEERPLAALLIAGAVGYALAYMLHARRS